MLLKAMQTVKFIVVKNEFFFAFGCKVLPAKKTAQMKPNKRKNKRKQKQTI